MGGTGISLAFGTHAHCWERMVTALDVASVGGIMVRAGSVTQVAPATGTA